MFSENICRKDNKQDGMMERQIDMGEKMMEGYKEVPH